MAFVSENKVNDHSFWSGSADAPFRVAWEGLAFERLCLQHVREIKSVLGISGVVSTDCAWQVARTAEHEGAQVDLLIDRRDGVINLCEMKFASAEYEIKDREERHGAVPVTPSEADFRAFTLEIVRAYFRTVREEVGKAAPGKLYLGCRFSGAERFVIEEAAKFCDVMSFNHYDTDVKALADAWPKGFDKPVMIGEFHFGALDRGPFTTGIVTLDGGQAERAATYVRYLTSALENPCIVGTHWHQYSDDVSTGRFDGENMQIGWTDVCDTPYPETIAVLRDIGARMYSIRFLLRPAH